MSETANPTEARTTKEIMSSMSAEDKKALKGWYFFDWANQAYALTVMTVIAINIIVVMVVTTVIIVIIFVVIFAPPAS